MHFTIGCYTINCISLTTYSNVPNAQLHIVPYLIIEITMNAHLWLRLPFEESIMQLLIININLSHFRPHTFTHLSLQRLLIFLFL